MINSTRKILLVSNKTMILKSLKDMSNMKKTSSKILLINQKQ